MKTKLYFLLLALLPLFLSCDEEDKQKEYDFTVLGIEEIKIGEVTINTASNGFPQKNIDAVTITGYTHSNETNEYELVILKNFPEDEAVEVQKKYNDVSVSIESDAASKSKTITISRAGYEEKVIYKLYFIVFEEA